jgi:membrane fusion protein, multidrug efflux system
MRQTRTVRVTLGALGALGLAVIAGCGGDSQATPNGRGGPVAGGGFDRAIPVAVEVVEPADLQVMLRGSANLRARQQVEVLPRQSGTIARILVEEGANVRQGQPLAVLDDQEWRLQARQTAARAQAARDGLERGRALQERGLLADQEVERLRSDAEVAAADAALADLRVQNAVIASPMTGVVTHRSVEQGQLVGANTVAFTVADVSRLETDVGVPEREAPRVQVGQPVRVRVEGTGPGVVGQVVRIRPVVDPGSGTVQVTIQVDQQGGGSLRAGQFVNVDIVTDVLQERIALPRTAVLVDGPTPRVYRVRDGHAEEVPVVTGSAHGERIEIQQGLQRGDTVVVVGQDNLRPGLPLLVMEVNGTAVANPQAAAPLAPGAPGERPAGAAGQRPGGPAGAGGGGGGRGPGGGGGGFGGGRP